MMYVYMCKHEHTSIYRRRRRVLARRTRRARRAGIFLAQGPTKPEKYVVVDSGMELSSSKVKVTGEAY